MRVAVRTLLVCTALAIGLAGCVVQETRPLPQLHAVQATSEIPAARVVDVGIHVFDPGIPQKVLDDPQEAEKERIYPEIRKAEARYIPSQLREALAGTGQWGAVRLVPSLVDSTDLIIDGRIIESNGAELKLAIHAADASGRVWLDKEYEGPADSRSYRDGGNMGRDPFQNVYVSIANDLLEAAGKLSDEQLQEVRRVARLRFASDFAPTAFTQYLQRDDKSGRYSVERLPAENDPLLKRVDAIRERDASLVDTVSDGYDAFSEKIDKPYSDWRRFSYDEILAEEKLKSQARNRIALGAIAVAAAVLVPSNCNSNTCDRVESAARYGAAAGGVAAVMSGLKKREEAKMHTDVLKELSNSFETEAAPLVVDVEGRTLRLTGTAEEQYAEWRRLLQQLYAEDTGLPADSVNAGGPAQAASGGGPG